MKSAGYVVREQNPFEASPVILPIRVEADYEHRSGYRKIFTPGVTAGLLKPADLARYHNDRVHIRESHHVSFNCGTVRDAMPALIELLKEETEPAVCIVPGHFILVYIHPYMDGNGNGRLARFLMNVMYASGGYPLRVCSARKHYVKRPGLLKLL